MNLFPSLESKYTTEQLSAREAQRLAEFIAWGPVVFQVTRIMMKFGIFDLIRESNDGLTLNELVEKTKLSKYALKCMLEASLCIGTILVNTENNRFSISKTGWFLINDQATKVNMDFNHDVNYEGFFHLEESLVNGKPEGLKHFGDWPTLYEGLSSFPEQVRNSWLRFDHFYSDSSFPEALKIVFEEYNTKSIYDVGGNTGKWALECVKFDKEVEVTIFDLPQQIEMMKVNISSNPNKDRIKGVSINFLDNNAVFPKKEGGLDAIWMSQFLDCFSEEEISSILTRAKNAMDTHTKLFIMETLWDRQRFEPAAFCLTMTSLYFTAIANGNSKMYNSDDIILLINNAGLKVEKIFDQLGQGHSIIVCTLND